MRWGGRGGDRVLGGDPVGGADLVGGGEAHEDNLDDGAGTGEPGLPLRLLSPAPRPRGGRRREGDRESRGVSFFFFFLGWGEGYRFWNWQRKGVAWELIPGRGTRSHGRVNVRLFTGSHGRLFTGSARGIARGEADPKQMSHQKVSTLCSF